MTASPEALAVVATLLADGTLKRSVLAAALDSFAAPVWERVEAAEDALASQCEAMSQTETRLRAATARTSAADARAKEAQRLADKALAALREARKLLVVETKRANDAEIAAAMASDLLREVRRKAEDTHPPAATVGRWRPFKAGPLPEPKAYQLRGGARHA